MKAILSYVAIIIGFVVSTFGQSLTSGLVAHYTFEGNTTDQSGRGNHASVAGSYQYLTPGLLGTGMRLFGDNALTYQNGGHVLLPTFSTGMNAGFSVSLWVKDETLGGDPTNEETYISYGIGDQPSFGINLNSTAKRILFYMNNGLAGGQAFEMAKLINYPSDLSSWKHLVVSYAPGNFAAYYNGTKLGEGNIIVNVFPTTRAALGRHWWGQFGASSARMTATYDNIRIYDRAISEADVQLIYSTDKSAPGTPPLIQVAPVPLSVTEGQSATFTIAVSGTPPLAYQWRKNDQPIPGATTSTLSFQAASMTDAGSFSVSVSNSAGSVSTAPVNLTVSAAVPLNPGQLINLSTRGIAGNVGNELIVGFSVRGQTSIRVLIRGVGPGLVPFGVFNVATNPMLSVFRGATSIASNDNWEEAGATLSAQAASSVGAFSLATGSLDSAVVVTLDPGSYTAQLRSDVPGAALVEVYQLP